MPRTPVARAAGSWLELAEPVDRIRVGTVASLLGRERRDQGISTSVQPVRRLGGYGSGMRNIDELREKVSGLLADAGVQFSYLFGSRARGRVTPGSDTDIAIRFSPEVPQDQRAERLLRLGNDLERVLEGPVDVVDLDQASFRLAGRIATERVILTGHGEPDRVRFETELVPRYLDARYHADRFDRLALEAMASGRR